MPDIAETYNYHLVEKHAAWTEAGPIVSRLSDPEIALLEGRAAATVAEPATLGLFGFATGTWIAGVVFGGFLPASAQVPLAPIVFLFAGVAQFIAGLYAFRRTNVLESNAFTCYGAFNTVVGLTILLEAGGLIPRGPASLYDPGLFRLLFRLHLAGTDGGRTEQEHDIDWNLRVPGRRVRAGRDQPVQCRSERRRGRRCGGRRSVFVWRGSSCLLCRLGACYQQLLEAHDPTAVRRAMTLLYGNGRRLSR